MQPFNLYFMNDKLNKEFISYIHKHAPAGVNIPNFIADVLNLGRESVYRRLRGEINFTFAEVAAISLKMGFSVDNIIGIKNMDQTIFRFPLLLQDKDPVGIYIYKINQDFEIYKKVSECKNSKTYLAMNSIPYILSLPYTQLSKFLFYKYVYQTGGYSSRACFLRLFNTR